MMYILHQVDSPLSRRRALVGLGASGLGFSLATRRMLTAAEEATPAMRGDIPSIVQAWVAAWGAADLEALLALYTEDAVFEEVAFDEVIEGKEAIGANLDQELTTFADLAVKVTHAFQAGDHAAAEVVFLGTYANQMPGGPPASGQPVALRAAVFFALAGDRIRRESMYFDANALLVQLGAQPAPAAGEGTPVAST